MTKYQIELIDPRAKALLEDLEKMELIKISGINEDENLESLLIRLRSKKDIPDLDSITEEVETVRQKRAGENG